MKNEMDWYYHEEGEDIHIWLTRWNMKKQVKDWDDAMAVNEAALPLGDTACRWFSMRRQQITTWDGFCQSLIEGFADDDQTLMRRLQLQKQYDKESVQSYADAIMLLCAQTGFPAAAQRDLFMKNLKSSLRKRVRDNCPPTLAEASRIARSLEAADEAESPEALKSYQEQRRKKPREDASGQDCVKELTEAFKDLRLHVIQHNRPHPGKNDRQPVRPPIGIDQELECFKCIEIDTRQ